MGGECFEVGQGFNERALMAPYPASVPRIYHSSGRSAETLFAVEYWVLPNFVTFTSSSRIPIVLLMFCNYSYDMHIHEEIRIKTFNCGCEGVPGTGMILTEGHRIWAHQNLNVHFVCPCIWKDLASKIFPLHGLRVDSLLPFP